MAPNGSIQLDSDFKTLKHEIIDYYYTQYPRKKISQPPCNKNTEVLWMHQYVKDREEWWDLPLEIDTDFPVFEKLTLKDKILFFLKKLFH